MFSSLNTIFQFWRKFWQKFGTKNNNNNKVILKIPYVLHARDKKIQILDNLKLLITQLWYPALKLCQQSSNDNKPKREDTSLATMYSFSGTPVPDVKEKPDKVIITFIITIFWARKAPFLVKKANILMHFKNKAKVTEKVEIYNSILQWLSNLKN